MMEENKMNIRSILIYFALTSADWKDVYERIRRRESISKADMDKVFVEHNVEKRKFVTIIDEGYPDSLKCSKRPPFVIEIIN